MIKTISAFFSFLIFLNSVIAQTDSQLRDPEYLVDQYNQLVAKHNALIEKTRNLLETQAQQPQSNIIEDPLAQEKLNEESHQNRPFTVTHKTHFHFFKFNTLIGISI